MPRTRPTQPMSLLEAVTRAWSPVPYDPRRERNANAKRGNRGEATLFESGSDGTRHVGDALWEDSMDLGLCNNGNGTTG
jgi:hypothetical protein